MSANCLGPTSIQKPQKGHPTYIKGGKGLTGEGGVGGTKYTQGIVPGGKGCDEPGTSTRPQEIDKVVGVPTEVREVDSVGGVELLTSWVSPPLRGNRVADDIDLEGVRGRAGEGMGILVLCARRYQQNNNKKNP